MSQAHLYCGHLQQFSGKQFQELFSEVAAIRAENPELFRFTHRPIDVYPSESVGESNPPTVSEEEILENLHRDRNRNYAIVIEGETGTGKSELCAYLAHELRDENRPILRIDKDDDLMSILTKRLPEFYTKHFDKDLPKTGAFEQLEKDIKNNPQTVASHAVTGALLKFSKQELQTDYDRDDEQVMVEIVEDQMDDLVTSGEYGKQRNLISDQQYERESAFHVFGPSVSKPQAVEEWNTELWNVIRDEYDTLPLSEMLDLVGDEFTDERPVIIFEDFSIASLEAKQLWNYVERDKPGDNWDFIIAGTRDVTEVLHTQTAEDRFEFFQTNKPNSNSVIFLDEDSAVDFIRPYLAYFKTFDGSVSYGQTSEGELDFSKLNEAPSDSICADCGLCSEEFRDVFPFNETFLTRIYAGLDESQQSPREYVGKVYEVLREYYRRGTNVPSSSDALGSDVTNPISPADQVYDRKESFADLAKWYGELENGYYVVDRAFCTAFGLIPEDMEDWKLEAGITVADGLIKIPAADSQTEKNGDDEGDTGRGQTKSKEKRIYDKRRGDVDDWIDDPENDRFSETNSYIRAALTDLIEEVTDDYTLWTDGKLRYNLSSQKAPFVYGNTASPIGDDQIILDTEEFRPSEVRQLLSHGIRLKETSNSPDSEDMLESLGTHITYYARNWRRQIIDQNIESNQVLYRKSDRGNFDFDDFVLASYALVTMLDDPWAEITAERLNERYSDDNKYKMHPEFRNKISDITTRDEFATLIDLFDYADEIESLMSSRFGVVTNRLDVVEIRRRLEKTTPCQVLAALAQTYIEEISGRVRFSPNKTLEDIASSVYQTHTVLTSLYDEHRPFDIHLQILNIFEGIDMDEIADKASRLKTYDNVDRDFVESLSRFADLDDEDVAELVAAAKMVEEDLGVGTTQDQIQTLAAAVRIHGCVVFQRLEELQSEWSRPSETDSGGRFQEVSDYYVK